MVRRTSQKTLLPLNWIAFPSLYSRRQVMNSPIGMTPREWRELADMAARMANVLRCPAIPPWPDWMTPEKRESMARHAEELVELCKGKAVPLTVKEADKC